MERIELIDTTTAARPAAGRRIDLLKIPQLPLVSGRLPMADADHLHADHLPADARPARRARQPRHRADLGAVVAAHPDYLCVSRALLVRDLPVCDDQRPGA